MKGGIAWPNGSVFFRHQIPYPCLFKTLARLRIGHTRLTHGHFMTHTDPPRCPSCHVPLSVVYFLIDCPRYASLRRSLFPSLLSHHPSRRLSLVLAESTSFNCDALFVFLTRSFLLSDL